jgi:hypothetical protein
MRSLWPQSLLPRLAIALGLAVGMILLLSILVERHDAGTRSNRRQRLSSAASKSVGEQQPQTVASDAALAPPSPSTWLGTATLGFELESTAGTIMVVQRESALPPDIAPVVEILATGELVLRRPVPLAKSPGQQGQLSRDGHGAGVVLPVASLESLTPSVRVALLGLLRRWLRERPVPSDRLRSSDLKWSPETMRQLLSWML